MDILKIRLYSKKSIRSNEFIIKRYAIYFSKENNVINMEDYSDIMIGEVKKK
ncbi:hypothetical protein JTT07_05770 [Clostridium botulinum]|nr:hypothetical protein [Clostridium botulinum]